MSLRQHDLACGKGELLCRWAAEFGTGGVGVDLSEVFLAAARDRADELGVADRVRFEHGDAGAFAAEPGAYDIVSCIGATWIGGGLAGTLDRFTAAAGVPGPVAARPPGVRAALRGLGRVRAASHLTGRRADGERMER